MPIVILLAAHTHAGKQHAQGDALDVSTPVAEWLVSRGVANFKPGVHKRPSRNPSVSSDGPAAGEPAAGDAAAADPANPLTAEPGEPHEH